MSLLLRIRFTLAVSRCLLFKTHTLTLSICEVIEGTNIGEHVTVEDFIERGAMNEKGEWQVPIKSLQQGTASYVASLLLLECFI